jgi:actin-related protein 3
VKGLNISMQAVLALISASGLGSKSKGISYTGTVLDSGDGVTHIIPIIDGFVINSCVKHIPLAGRKMTNFIEGMIRDRNENCPT